MSQGILWVLLLVFVVCSGVAVIEGRLSLGLYWLGAAIIQVALIVGMK